MPFRTDKHYPSHNFDICELVDSYKKYIMKEIMYKCISNTQNKFYTTGWSTNLWILLTIKFVFCIVFIVLGIAKCFKASKTLY